MKTKEGGVCNKCFDKGYRTELKGVRDLGHIRDGKTYSDFSGKQINTFISMEFCSCDRGKELKKNVKEYADWKIRECLPEKRNLEHKNQDKNIKARLCQWFDNGFNYCIDQILSNKDKK